MKLINALGIVAVPATVPSGNLLWVDAVSGNDSLARRGCLTVPFKTLSKAKDAAASGDTIIVMPGTYNENDLLRDGINWHFLPGAIVSYTGSTAIFNTGSTIQSLVTGWGRFNTGSTAPVINFSNSGSNLTVEALSLSSASGACVRSTAGSGMLSVRARESILSSSEDAIYVSGAEVFIEARKVSTSGGHGLYVSGGQVFLKAHTILASTDTAIHVGAGLITVSAILIRSETHIGVSHDGSTTELTILGAKIVSDLDSAVISSGSSNKLKLANCVLVAGSGPCAEALSPDTRVHFLNGVAGNVDISSNIIPVGGDVYHDSAIS